MRDLYFSKWDKLSKKEIQNMQGVLLNKFINTQIFPYSPFYHEMFIKNKIFPEKIKTLKDLQSIPFTTKNDIAPTEEDRKKYKNIILQPDVESIKKYAPLQKKLSLLYNKLKHGEKFVKLKLLKEYKPIMLFFTTGRSALPTPFGLSQYDIDLFNTVGERLVNVLDLDPENDMALNLFPYAPHLAFWQVVFCGWGGDILLLSTGGGKVAGTAGNINAINKLRPSLIVGIPGYVYHLLRQAESEGHDFSFIKKVALGGEKVPDALKTKVKNILNNMGGKNPNVASVLGFTEARKCWAECTGDISTGFHTYPDLEIFEIINPETGKVLGEGETGELVYTGLVGRGSCVVRYRTGDIVEGGITCEPCPQCGRTVPRISTKISRVSNIKDIQVSKVKGTLVNLNVFIQILSEYHDVDEWQIVLKKKDDDPFELDELLVFLSTKIGVDEKKLRIDLEQKFINETEVHPNQIIITSLGDMLNRLGMDTKLKEERIIDLRPKK